MTVENAHYGTINKFCIVVTIPRSKLAEVEAEEADVARRIAQGKTGLGYYWQMRRMPRYKPERIYFVWEGAVRAWHAVTGIDDSKIYMDPEIHHIDPVPMKGFQGFRYYNYKLTNDRALDT